jgi:hypothetical protein
MAHQAMKYRLNQNGTVPEFLCLESNGVGGVFVVGDPTTPSPRDMVMVGISCDNATGDFEVFASQSDLQNYLATVGANWTQPDPSQPNNPDATIPFDPTAAASWVWGRLEALNAA